MADPLDGPDLIALGAIWHARLQDGTSWTDRKGIARPLAQMGADHRSNVRAYLRHEAERLHLLCSLYLISKGEDDLPRGTTALDWLYQTPLFRSLVANDVVPSTEHGEGAPA